MGTANHHGETRDHAGIAAQTETVHSKDLNRRSRNSSPDIRRRAVEGDYNQQEESATRKQVPQENKT